MKRTPLKRKTPMRRTALPSPARQDQLRTVLRRHLERQYGKARKPLPPVSKKLAANNAEYEAAKKKWRAGHDGRCEMLRYYIQGPVTGTPLEIGGGEFEGYYYPGTRGGTNDRCPRLADKNPHHMAGRGPNLSRIETFLGVCRQCHEWIHAHARQARRLGYLFTK